MGKASFLAVRAFLLQGAVSDSVKLSNSRLYKVIPYSLREIGNFYKLWICYVTVKPFNFQMCSIKHTTLCKIYIQYVQEKIILAKKCPNIFASVQNKSIWKMGGGQKVLYKYVSSHLNLSWHPSVPVRLSSIILQKFAHIPFSRKNHQYCRKSFTNFSKCLISRSHSWFVALVILPIL